MNITAIMGFLALPLGWAMKLLYQLVNNYGWTIIIFTFVIRLLSFPLTLQQQKSTARNSAFQPMIQDIQKKWAKDKNRQNEEVMKFQQENNMKMTAGCLPAIINMVIIFSMLAVIQAPLKYIVNVPQTQIDSGIAIVKTYYTEEQAKKINMNTEESILIGEIRENPEIFVEGVETKDKDGKKVVSKMEREWVDAIEEFNFDFMGMDLSDIPHVGNWVTLILPIVSILTSILMQVIMSLTSGQKQTMAMMLPMLLISVVMFGFYAFAAPVGFSLYYTISNIAYIAQQFIVKQIHDPEVEKQKVIAEIEERKKAQKAKKVIVVEDKKGNKLTKEVTKGELERLRLERARKLDDELYAEEKEEEKQREIEDAKAARIAAAEEKAEDEK